jgi:mannitol-1-/sugar-/sorbitol-6-phosphatase
MLMPGRYQQRVINALAAARGGTYPEIMRLLGRTFHAALFDMDGTLVDSARSIAAVWTRWAERVGEPAAPIVAYSHGRPSRSTVARFAPARDLDAELAWLRAAELTDRTPVAAVVGAGALLASLAVPWAIVTAADEAVARRRLALAGLPVPRVLVTIERVARGKPAPDGYLEAARCLGVPAAACVVFEDSPVGIEAARRAGMSVIGLATTVGAVLVADAIIDDYTALARAA